MYQFYISPTDYATAQQNGIHPRLVTERVRHLAWSIKRAITEPPKVHMNWEQWLKIAGQNGIRDVTFYGRVCRGMEPEKAATTQIMSRKENVKKMADKIRVYPKEYAELAQTNGISLSTFGTRMRRGWTAIDAATRPIDGRCWTKKTTCSK